VLYRAVLSPSRPAGTQVGKSRDPTESRVTLEWERRREANSRDRIRIRWLTTSLREMVNPKP